MLRTIEGYESFNPQNEVLDAVKPIYGLKDAPRAWRKRLHQVLCSFKYCQLVGEPELYVQHEAKEEY